MINIPNLTIIEENKNNIRMGNAKRVRIRIRNGKVQRNHVVTSRKGFKVKNGVSVRQSFSERMHRQIAQRIASIKRRMKLSQSLRKRKASLRKRKAQGG